MFAGDSHAVQHVYGLLLQNVLGGHIWALQLVTRQQLDVLQRVRGLAHRGQQGRSVAVHCDRVGVRHYVVDFSRLRGGRQLLDAVEDVLQLVAAVLSVQNVLVQVLGPDALSFWIEVGGLVLEDVITAAVALEVGEARRFLLGRLHGGFDVPFVDTALELVQVLSAASVGELLASYKLFRLDCAWLGL